MCAWVSTLNEQISLEYWESLNQAFRDQVRALSLTKQQIEYAGTIERSIERCCSDSSGDVPGVAIVRRDFVVGFLELKRRLAAPIWASTNTAVVSSLRVDLRFQGQGIGTVGIA